ncbi:DNA topoisomerase I [Roseivirga pacifica]|uniref:DNA topoisomerase 1 n=1 Tax=Roseivirga pacifica TaxID=1267423 RepID=A0A1I0PZM9_9BACT|nr:type I DNA topoisomerase [Roseivirga pacifica]RKQ43386.1 DNA topoisomerase I [Roseivirga pacifica]SEW20046.1 DNA topoisomerase I [Roseivirga pacifica]
MSKNLVIVESPAKAKTIEGYLGKDFKVVSSYGHVRDLPKGDKAIDIENKFKPTYEVTADKKDVIRQLRKLSKDSSTIYLASDDDREGEAISWHLKEALKLNPANTKRIVFREITKSAIQKALENPREIDEDLVNAQQARRILDRIVGYELSPVLWKKIKRGLSAGRVQSVAVRLVVEREREVDKFEAESSFKITALFDIQGRELKAELGKKFKTEAEAQAFLDKCNGAEFSIQNLETKPAKRSPAPPFTTSTLQQEASRKLSFSVSQTMSLAQRLYEAGKISYMRTDSVNLSNEAVQGATNEITNAYGAEYVQNRRFKTKSQGAQEAHEAIRPTNFAVHSTGDNYNEQRLYDLIWKRAAASQMADAQLEKTTATIGISTTDETLVANGEVVKFDGFLKVYLESTDEENEEEAKGMLPPLAVGEVLDLTEMGARESFTRPPARYTEASLVKKLEEMGIGRPSTYAPTISTIQKRDYVIKESRDGMERKYRQLRLKDNKVKAVTNTEITGTEKNKLFPTNIAMVVNDFLVDHFPNVIDYSFTAKVEEEFDQIAHGYQKWDDMIDSFYGKFHKTVESTEDIKRSEVGSSREIGTDPESGKPVIARLGKFGPLVQIGENSDDEDAEKPKFASLRKGQFIESITLEEALELFKLPRTVGEYKGEEVTAAIGRFGPYIRHNSKFISLPKDADPLNIELDEAILLIKAKEEADAPIYEYQGKPVQKGKGRFGPFIKWNEMFINVNKKYDWDNLSANDIEELIEDKLKKEREKVIHNWEDAGVRIEKARWGRHNVIKGKVKVELAKNIEVKDMTLDEAEAIIEQNAPKKKTRAKKK